ncbi:MAG: peptide-methionine (S)-S-oxide reductase MsrA [Coxiellaceae bacterium]|nr:peptide-methionine (S)-S-oxide reductase MsrA [Coxiellaceae bacterium]
MSESATFAAGCFWGVQAGFDKLDGIKQTTVGYSGGSTENPTYNDVCRGDTGHAECIDIVFDPDIISYQQLLDHFWQCHTPTMLNRQGPDVGSQYRSAVFYHNENQQQLAKSSKQQLDASGTFDKPIVTEITQASVFYPAEEYHQKYAAKHR